MSACLTIAASAEFTAALAHAQATISSPNPKFEYLDPATAAELDALTALIIPSDDGPGAHEAGVVFFIDRALATFAAEDRPSYRDGLATLQNSRAQFFPKSTSIHLLSQSEQITLLKSIQHSDFFDLLRTHTVLGFLGNPSYGGNRDGIGWQRIGFDHHMAYKPPFGYYDGQQISESKT